MNPWHLNMCVLLGVISCSAAFGGEAASSPAPAIVGLREQFAGPVSPLQASASEFQAEFLRLAQQPAPVLFSPPAGPKSPVNSVDTLRTAAFALEYAANDLEQAGCYSEADRLQAEAQELRLTARRLETPSTAKPQPVNTAPISERGQLYQLF